MAIFYFFVIAPSSIVPSSCGFSYGVACPDLVFGSNSTSSKVVLLLTNTQQYPVLNPILYINSTYIGNIRAACSPSFVLPGGAIICNISIPNKAISMGTLVNGKLYLQAKLCPSWNASSCSSAQPQTYAGSFVTHAAPLLQSTPVSLSLYAENTSQVATGALDKLVATVEILGYPLTGATINFTIVQSQNGQQVKLQPSMTTSSSNGEAISYISSTSPGIVDVVASFAGTKSNIVSINFTSPVYVTFESSQMQGTGSNPVVYVDNKPFNYSRLPITFAFAKNSKHTFSYAQYVSGIGTRYAFVSSTGCNVNAQAGTITASSNCTIYANYKTQYYLSMSASPSGSATVSPSSNYYDAGTQLTISVSTTAGNKFKGWVGTGTGSYTGTSPTAEITMDSPISETAYTNVILDYITFSTNPVPSKFASNTVLYVDNTPYTFSQLPITFSWQEGSQHTYSFVNDIYVNTPYAFSLPGIIAPQKGSQQTSSSSSGLDREHLVSVSGCGNSASGTITVSHSCNIDANYVEQYYLYETYSATYPCRVYGLSPGSGWYDSGSHQTIFANVNWGCLQEWYGSGTVSYSGFGVGTIIMDTPIVE
ncbi:MAG: InlB B-repeat-containing protein, partial [Candidatus Micrarchaeia archaeon]